LVAIEKDPLEIASHLKIIADDDSGIVYETQTEKANYKGISQSILKALRVRERFRPLRGLTYPERRLIEFEPRCLHWCVHNPSQDTVILAYE
jgi:hypothetical protein